MKIKKIFSLIFVFSLVLYSSLFALDATKSQISSTSATNTASVDNETINALFIQNSAAAKILPHETDSAKLKLVMQNVMPNVIWFADRPVRKSGVISIEQFIGNWNKGENSFAKNNPNAALSSDANKKDGKVVEVDIVVLSNPLYDFKHKTLTYDIKGDTSKLLHKAGSYRNVVVFIDSLNFNGD